MTNKEMEVLAEKEYPLANGNDSAAIGWNNRAEVARRAFIKGLQYVTPQVDQLIEASQHLIAFAEGSLPPMNSDEEFTINQILEFKKVFDRIYKYPARQVKPDYNNSYDNIDRILVQKANDLGLLFDAGTQRIDLLLEILSFANPIDAATGQVKEDWISVKEKPLIDWDVNENNQPAWNTTKAGDGEFMAAVPYNDKNQPGKELWWIRHCVIEDNIGLCVVGDDSNEPAGWEIQDVTHYQPLPNPPANQTFTEK